MNADFMFDKADTRRNVALDGEHPDVIVQDVLSRIRPEARVIVIANEKGGTGKSTIAFHLCVALEDSGLSVAALDLDRRQQTLSRALLNREATARRLGVALPQPKHQVAHITSGAMLCQEMSRVGWNSDVIVIDVVGCDSPIARRAIALADTLVTPVNSSFVDLDLLARYHPVSLDLMAPGCFSIAVNEISRARQRKGVPAIDWIVVQNRMRRGVAQKQDRIKVALEQLAPQAGFRIGTGLPERLAYRDLFLLGLTHLDMRRIPDFAKTKLDANKEILSLVTDLAIPRAPEPPVAAVEAEPLELVLEAMLEPEAVLELEMELGAEAEVGAVLELQDSEMILDLQSEWLEEEEQFAA